MKKIATRLPGWSLVLLTLGMALIPLSAQTPPQDSPGGPQGEVPRPLIVVSGFLQLSEVQTEELVRLRQGTEPQIMVLGLEVRMREERLAQELQSPEPDLVLIGQLAVEIRTLRQEAAQRQQEFLEDFSLVLDEQQQGRLQLIFQAARLQQVLPAFHAVGLIR